MNNKKILIVTQEIDSTADVMVALLNKRGAAFERVHPGDIPNLTSISIYCDSDNAAHGNIQGPGLNFDWSDIKSVWYRRPEPPKFPDDLTEEESDFAFAETTEFVFGLWRAMDVLWINHPDKIRRAASKPLQLSIAQKLGFRIPKTLITSNPEELREFARTTKTGVIYKAFTQGHLGLSQREVLYANRLRPEHLQHADLLRNTPGIFQEEIKKKLELRITVIGKKVFPAEIHSQEQERGEEDWRRADVAKLKHAVHKLPKKIEKLCLALVEYFQLNYGAIDMILTPEGDYVFLEINPSGQYGWIEDLTGLPLTESLADLLISA